MTAILEELSQVLSHLEAGGEDNHSFLDLANQNILNNNFTSDVYF